MRVLFILRLYADLEPKPRPRFFWEAGNHHVASCDVVIDEMSSGCILESYTKLV